MFTLETTDEILEKLREMLADEDEGTCVRLREYKVGGG
jgi:iron-sulfur cluster insertion protein